MCRFGLTIALIAGVLALVLHAAPSGPAPIAAGTAPVVQERAKSPAAPAADRTADEAAIRANVEAFVRAYNARDARAVAALFLPDGLAMGNDGNVAEGREAIEKTFAALFADQPQKRTEVLIDSIRFIGTDLAIEVGTTKETAAPGEAPEYDGYTVLHVKRDGKWQMAAVRDTQGEAPTSHERLLPLAWLVGDWVDDGGSVVVHSTCRWAEGGNFLLLEFKVHIAGREEMQVSQRIGWDPLAKTVRSWVFDTEGGYGESVWTRTNGGWLIRATGVRSDGTTASATNMLIPTGTDGYVWRSTNRVVADEALPNVEVKIVRKPPQPKQ